MNFSDHFVGELAVDDGWRYQFVNILFDLWGRSDNSLAKLTGWAMCPSLPLSNCSMLGCCANTTTTSSKRGNCIREFYYQFTLVSCGVLDTAPGTAWGAGSPRSCDVPDGRTPLATVAGSAVGVDPRTGAPPYRGRSGSSSGTPGSCRRVAAGRAARCRWARRPAPGTPCMAHAPGSRCGDSPTTQSNVTLCIRFKYNCT